MKKVFRRFQNISPGSALILYYATAILGGSFVLCLPWAVNGPPLSFLDALFTATSAQCVTGLIVVDTGTRFTLLGQMTILALIQTGGIGITTFSVYLFFYFRLGIRMRDRWILQETLVHTPVESLADLIRKIILFTFVIEGAGTFFLALEWIPKMGWAKGLYCSLFHSVSAFCNAGFSLFSDSLIASRPSPLVNLTIMTLIIMGGIGFLVLYELLNLVRSKRKRRRISLHSKLVLWTTAGLIVGGTSIILFLEGRAALEGMGLVESVWTALFQSVTARTAGFNTIDLNQLEVPTLFLLIFLMFVGASPGSCGGGIKTTSLALFIAILTSKLKGVPHTNVFHRTVPEELSTKTLTLVMLSILFVGIASFLLLSVQLAGLSFLESRGVFMEYFFEAVSAFATVGLSLGATAKLNHAGKIIIILLMFIGRIGILTLAFTIIQRSRKDATYYAEENIMIG